MIKLNLKNYQAVSEVLKRLNILRRWTFFTIEGKYNELAKQALNCIVAYMLASFCEKADHKICWERFPKIAIYRAFQKSYVYFDTPEYIIKEISAAGNIKKMVFDQTTQEMMKDLTDEEFAEFICEGLNTCEMKIYKAATKIATLLELTENRFKMSASKEYDIEMQDILMHIKKYSYIPGVDELQDIEGNLFKLMRKISKLRNQNRWSVMSYTIDCSVLGHLFDTAIYAYLCGLEKYGNEQKATELFFNGIFHDVPETWTKDIPKPIKNHIPGFRDAIKKYENDMLEKYFYSNMPKFLSGKIRKIMEQEEVEETKRILKGADYLSADAECWRFYKTGSKDEYFLETAMKNFQKDLDENKYELPKNAYAMHRCFYEYAEGLHLKAW